MKVEANCLYCGELFSAPKWKGRLYCSKACGNHSSKNKRHGMSKTPEHNTWTHIRERCNKTNHKDYPHYGGRGIRVCARWDVFENFVEDMGIRPAGMTIDRIDGNGDYEPGNCRWATRTVQSQNRGKYTYSTDEDQKIREAISLGYNFPKMAEYVGRSMQSVMARTYRLGLTSGQAPTRDYSRSNVGDGA